MSNILISSKLKELRKNSGFSVKDVSDYLCSKGLYYKPKSVYNWESGVREPSLDVFIELCKLYGVEDVISEFEISEKKYISNIISNKKRDIAATMSPKQNAL